MVTKVSLHSLEQLAFLLKIFILSEIVFQVALAALQQKNNSVLLIKLLKLIASLYSNNTVAIHSNI